jgi:hypothetical protein
LTTVGYLTFIQGMELDDAVRLVKERRSQAHPYLDCWHTARKRLLFDRRDEVGLIAAELFEKRSSNGHNHHNSDEVGDFYLAERMLIQRIFQRRMMCNNALLQGQKELMEAEFDKKTAAAASSSTNSTSGSGVDSAYLTSSNSNSSSSSSSTTMNGIGKSALALNAVEVDRSLLNIKERLRKAGSKLALASEELSAARGAMQVREGGNKPKETAGSYNMEGTSNSKTSGVSGATVSSSSSSSSSGKTVVGGSGASSDATTAMVTGKLQELQEEMTLLTNSVDLEQDPAAEARRLRRALILISETTKCLLEGGQEAHIEATVTTTQAGSSQLLMSTLDD